MQHKVKVTMLIAGLGLSGTPRIMMDIIENLSRDRFEVSVAYKPEFTGFEDDLLTPLKNLGIQTIPLRGQKLFDVSGIMDLFKHLQKNSTHIIHCWDALGIAARVLKLITGCRVVESFGNPVTSKGSYLYYQANKITSIFLDGLIFASEGVEKSLRSANTLVFRDKVKTKVIHNSINTEKIINKSYDAESIRSKWKLNDNDIVLTNTGMFNDQKAQAHLLQVMEIILKEIPSTKLMLVGWGSKEQELRNAVGEKDLQNNVIFTGKLPHEDVFEILAITDIFVLSSLWEGFGLVMGEAMAMGKPVVATRTDGSELLVIDGKTGVLVPTGDYRSIANSVIELLKNPVQMQKMGEMGKQKILTYFTPETFIQRHESFYNEII